ncbi:MAG: 4Fe-4S dicluster domain-containing protein [Bacteroidia bacterium]|nr:MAG: 4Fe-4S dicluster domain-containing protein [Bacteroidia bacterium]
MMKNNYWKSLEEKEGKNPVEELQEHKESSMIDVLANESNTKASSRRDFLKWCGISFVSATVLSACENPVKKAIPYLTQPEELTPGKGIWYASTYQHGNEYCPILVKNRDGRPIKIEGNYSSAITGGGTTARVQASILTLYDNGARYQHPRKNGQPITWDDADREIIARLKEFSAQGRKMALVTPSLLSPATKTLISQAQEAFPGLEVITWDPVSLEGIRQAHMESFGTAVFPEYRFDKAKLIVSFGADFLGSWISPAVHARQYAATRKISQDKPEMSRHIQIESRMSITGANADERIPVKPSEQLNILMALYNAMARATGNTGSEVPDVDYDVDSLARDILSNRGQSLIVCDHQSKESQVLVNAINIMAGNYNNTLLTENPLMTGMGDDTRFEQLLSQMEEEQYAAVIFCNSNPVYHFHDRERITKALNNTELTISFASTRDETAETCTYILPDNHFLESWNDAMFKEGHYSLAQPAIHRLFNTRQMQDTLLAWMGDDNDFHTWLKEYWSDTLFGKQSRYPDRDSFWMHSLQAGVFEHPVNPVVLPAIRMAAATEAIRTLRQYTAQNTGTEYLVYPHLSLYDGASANNPWLQELPDPVTSVAWDNFAAVSPAFAKANNISDGDVIRIGNGMTIPVLIQPGQADDCIAIALGYGRTQAGKAGDLVGSNAFPLIRKAGTARFFNGQLDAWEKTGDSHRFARTQTHFSMEGRPIVRESTLDKYQKDPAAGNELRAYHQKYALTLYPEDRFEGHHWALMIDLNACTGCSTCVIACQSENNVPVVGKDEVRRRRIMHWLRVDRYYNGEPENPGVVFQPVMCMHCDHAPCENVCPVAATTHSVAGINQMAYNRCVGTKYCINNCPYKVRRFNWFAYANNKAFDYHMNSDFGRMVLNPDVTVRERGVVEKCSFCVQRIQEGKLNAKSERRKLKDGEILPACVQSCPAGALVFGDLNDKDSRVAGLIKDPRNYHLLEELHTLPSVGYLTKIRNPKA